MPRQDCLRVRPGKRRLPHQQLVQHAPQRVHVAPPVQLPLPGRLLRTHVGRRPHRDPCLRQPLRPSRPDRPRNPKIRHDRVAARQQDVLRLDIPVHHAPTVGVRQGIGHFPRQLHRLLQGERALAP